MSTDTRMFHLGDILTVTTGCLVSPRHMDGVYDLLNFMTGDDLMTHQLPRAGRECAPALLDQHPQLCDVVVPEFDGEAHVWRWLGEQVDRYGMELPVQPLSSEEHTRIGTLAEMAMMRPHMEVIRIEVPRDGAA